MTNGPGTLQRLRLSTLTLRPRRQPQLTLLNMFPFRDRVKEESEGIATVLAGIVALCIGLAYRGLLIAAAIKIIFYTK